MRRFAQLFTLASLLAAVGVIASQLACAAGPSATATGNNGQPQTMLVNDTADQPGGVIRLAQTETGDQSPAPPAGIEDEEKTLFEDSPLAPDPEQDLSVDLEGGLAGDSLLDDQAGGSKAAGLDTSQDGGADLSPIRDLDREQQAVDLDLAAKALALTQKLDRLEKLIESQNGLITDLQTDVTALKASAGHEVAKPVIGEQSETPEQTLAFKPLMGRLMVQNDFNSPYQLRINGVTYIANPGKSELDVPAGAVTTELLGYETAKTWQVKDWKMGKGGPELAILISDAQQTTALRPIEGGDELTGKLVVTNNSLVPRQIRINGQTWWANPGRSQIAVPLGQVTTELVGFEFARIWSTENWQTVDGQQQLGIVIN